MNKHTPFSTAQHSKRARKHVHTALQSVAFVAGALVLTGCDGMFQQSGDAAKEIANQATGSVVGAVANQDVLVIGVYDDYAPLSFLDATGHLQGFDIELAKAVMNKMGKRYEFRPIDWTDKERLLSQERQVDMLWSGVHVSKEREDLYGFSDYYLENPTVVVVRQGSEMQSPRDLGGRVVGVQDGFFAKSFLESYSNENGGIRRIVTHPESSLVLVDVLDGTVEAAVVDAQQAAYFVANTPGKFKVLSEPLLKTSVAVALRKGDDELRSNINQALKAVRDDGTYAKLRGKWLGK